MAVKKKLSVFLCRVELRKPFVIKAGQREVFVMRYEIKAKLTVVAVQITMIWPVIAAAEVKKLGVFRVSGLCRFKFVKKPAVKTGEKDITGKMRVVRVRLDSLTLKACFVATLSKKKF